MFLAFLVYDSVVNRYVSKGGGVLFLTALLKTMFLCGGNETNILV